MIRRVATKDLAEETGVEDITVDLYLQRRWTAENNQLVCVQHNAGQCVWSSETTHCPRRHAHIWAVGTWTTDQLCGVGYRTA